MQELWFTDNQVDGMGDDTPPGEINRAPKAGMKFGMPWYGGGQVRTNEYADETPPEGLTPPVVETIAHAADMGLTFYTGKQFPEQYRGGLFSAQRGSWNRTVPAGARVMFTPFAADGSGPSGETVPFAEGWLDEETGEYYGRIVDVAQLKDGSLLVSDDTAGAHPRSTACPSLSFRTGACAACCRYCCARRRRCRPPTLRRTRPRRRCAPPVMASTASPRSPTHLTWPATASSTWPASCRRSAPASASIRK